MITRKQLNFPSYEFLKALPLVRKELINPRYGEPYESEMFIEYDFTLFKLPIDVYARFTYNEDDSGLIMFDVMQEGYCDHNDFNRRLKFNKKNYTAICKYAQNIYELFISELEKDVPTPWLDMTPEQFAEKYGY